MSGQRAIAYIDGFNLYHGALRGTPFRWLDVVALMDDLLRGHTLIRVKYFTARVDDRPDDPGMAQRQDLFLRALEVACGPRLEVHFGKFTTHKRKMGLVARSSDGEIRFATVYRTEEKGSDVNLGAHLVWDACHRNADVFAVVSNDSDLQTPITMAVDLQLEVVTINPHRHGGQAQHLFGTDQRQLTRRRLFRNRLPDPVIDGEGQAIHCPAKWLP